MQGGFETQPSRLAPLLSCEVLQARVLVIACHGWLWRRRFTLVRCKPFFSAATAFLSLWVLRRYAFQREQLRLLAVARLLDGAVTQWKHTWLPTNIADNRLDDPNGELRLDHVHSVHRRALL